MSKGISPQLEDKIKQYQSLQQRISMLQQQLQQLKMDKNELERSIKELENLSEDEVCYRSIGSIMIKSTVKETRQKLQDKSELTETRIELTEKNKNKLTKQFEDLEKQIRAGLEGQGVAPAN